jgi:hypothetical protein
MAQPQRAGFSWYWPLAAAILVLAIALRLWLYDPWGQYHADEFNQYLEQGHRLAEGYGRLTWELRLGLRNGLIPQFLALPMKLGAVIAPGSMLPIHLARLSFMALCLASLAGAWGLGRAHSRVAGLAALLVVAVWYDSAFFGVTLLSESAATAILLCGAALLLVERAGARTMALAGFLLALGALVRAQYAPFVVVLALLSLWHDRRIWRPLAIGAALALALGAISDLANHQVPFSWALRTVTVNLGEGAAARFGTEGPLYYPKQVLAAFGPAAALIALASLFAGRRYWPLIAANLANLAVHSAIAHKEYRFIWLSLLLTLVLAAISSVRAIEWAGTRRKLGRIRLATGFGAVLAGWLALALLAARGAEARLPRPGEMYPQAVHEVAARPQICGVAYPEQWQNQVITAFLGRNVPLYVIPAEIGGGLSPLPDELARSANAVLDGSDVLLSNPGYTSVACHERNGERACLLVREGGCEPALGKAYEMQAWMNEKNL